MIHRSEDHPDKVKPCRDQDNCTRTSCWYKHNKKKAPESSPDEEESVSEWISDELDSETEGFQGVQIPTKPPLNQQMRNHLI